MAGFRIAFAVGNKEVISLLKGYIRASVGGTFGSVQDAATYALLYSEKERGQLRKLYKERRDLVLSLLEEHNIDVIKSEGTFFIWIKLPKTIDDITFVEEFLAKEQVALIPCSTFGEFGKGYIRLSLVSDLRTIQLGIEKLIAFLEKKRVI